MNEHGRAGLGLVVPAAAIWLLSASVATAQDASQQQGAPPAPEARQWSWTTDANVFFGYNYQRRYFLDYSAWESQNWFMAAGGRPVGSGRLAVDAMLSLEPFTMHAQGSPQLFQTGESYQRTPLVNYQHPHDLLMRLGATYRIGRAGAAFFAGADLVGSPTLGPAPFMHRESARDNPQAPLTHHFIDSTHITQGVVRAGAEIGPLTLESSVFRGEEPNEDRVEIERATARFVGRARPVEPRVMAGAGVGRTHAPARVVRAVRPDPHHRVARLRRPRARASAEGHPRMGRKPAVQRVQRQR